MKCVLAGNEIIVKSELLQDEISFVFAKKEQAEMVYPVINRVVDFAQKQDIELVAQIEDMLELPEVENEDV